MSVAMETESSEMSQKSFGKKQGPPTLPRRRSRTREEPVNNNELRELQTAFSLFDRNGDGKICRLDLLAALELLGRPVNDQMVDNILKNTGNRHGEIHEDAFMAWMDRTGNSGATSGRAGDDSTLREAFTVLDRDGDGLLSMEDMKNGLGFLGENISDKMLSIMFQEADRNGNGRITYEDFARMLRK